MPRISVIVPVYKVEDYLRRCVDSLLAQSFTDFELILVDDGSPDNCPEICDEYADKDPRVVVIHRPNGGLSAARNLGIDWTFTNSNSQWITFVDSDDWVHPQYLEVLYQAVSLGKCKIAVGNFVRVEEFSDTFESIEKASCFKTENAMEFYIEEQVLGVIACGKLYDKSLFDRIRYPEGRIHEDEFVTYKLLFYAGTVAVCDDHLYFYFSNPTGITKSPFSTKNYAGWIAKQESCDFFLEKGLIKNYIVQAERTVAAIRGQFYTAQEQGMRDCCRDLQKALRKAMWKYRKACHFTLKKDYYTFDVAYPKLVWIYDRLRSVPQKVFRRERNQK